MPERSPANGRRWLLTLAGGASVLYGLAHIAGVPLIVGAVVLLEVWVLEHEH